MDDRKPRRVRKNKEADALTKARYLTSITNLCSVDGCAKKAVSKAETAVCHMHASRIRVWGHVGGALPDLDLIGRPRIQGSVRYQTAHARLRDSRGPASGFECVDCGGEAHEWSYRGDSSVECSETIQFPTCRRPTTLYFSPETEDYDPRCRKCHRRFDQSLVAKRLEREGVCNAG